MDTGTHFVFGLGLAGLSQIDPLVQTNPELATAVFIGTMLGSQIPDIDTLYRLKSNASYVKNHRGYSHSLPAMAMWTLLITSVLGVIFNQAPLLHIGLWVGIAIVVHVFTDLFNSYGTQAGLPFTKRWIRWNIIHIFDPFIFISHLIAIAFWAFRLADATFIFPTLYLLIILYYGWRSYTHYKQRTQLYAKDSHYEDGDDYIMIPTVRLHHWNVVKCKTDGSYMLGELKDDQLQWQDRLVPEHHPAIEASKTHPDVAALLYYSASVYPKLKEHTWGYEVRWADVRYGHRKQYPFVAVVLMNKQFNPLCSYVGWLSETKIEKKLSFDAQATS